MIRTLNRNQNIFWDDNKITATAGIDYLIKNKMGFAAGKLIFCAFDFYASLYIGYDDTKNTGSIKLKRKGWVPSGGAGRSKTSNPFETTTLQRNFINYLENCCFMKKTEGQLLGKNLWPIRNKLVHENRLPSGYSFDWFPSQILNGTKLSLSPLFDLLKESIKDYESQLNNDVNKKTGRRIRMENRLKYYNNK